MFSTVLPSWFRMLDWTALVSSRTVSLSRERRSKTIRAPGSECSKRRVTQPQMLKDLANAGSKFDARLLFHMVHTSPFTEGAFRRRSVAERGWRRLQARLAPSSQEARSPSGPDEGPAFNGWTRSDEGQRGCCPDHVRGSPSGPLEEAR